MDSDEETQKPQFIPFKKRGDIWSDIEPVPQFSDNVEILKIDYSNDVREINDYFRAILQNNEISIRAYNLTTEMINTSATNYMAWYHRRLCLDNIKELDLQSELNWLDSITVENQKNYQIWHHRKVLVEKLNDPTHEKPLLDEVFKDEPKNFHAWCHRIWVVRRFDLIQGEMDYIESKLEEVK